MTGDRKWWGADEDPPLIERVLDGALVILWVGFFFLIFALAANAWPTANTVEHPSTVTVQAVQPTPATGRARCPRTNADGRQLVVEVASRADDRDEIHDCFYERKEK